MLLVNHVYRIVLLLQIITNRFIHSWIHQSSTNPDTKQTVRWLSSQPQQPEQPLGNSNNNNNDDCDNGNDKIYIVTGANGFIGRAIVHQLLDRVRSSATTYDVVVGRRRTVSTEQSTTSSAATRTILCLVRSRHVRNEQVYWNEQIRRHQQQRENHHRVTNDDNDDSNTTTAPICSIHVYPYDMLDNGHTFQVALNFAFEIQQQRQQQQLCVFHVASVFGPTDQFQQTAYDNVRGTVDLIHTLGTTTGKVMRSSNDNSDNNTTTTNKLPKCRLIVTSSMAAVRGTGQEPLNQLYYTNKDWNTNIIINDTTTTNASWGTYYQWSKAESERRAWELCHQQWNDCISMTSLCPSFVFGPPQSVNNDNDDDNSNTHNIDAPSSSSSYSIALVDQWIRGVSPVQSRLLVDIRDVAKAHVLAAHTTTAIGQRIIVSTETRVSSQQVAQWIKETIRQYYLDRPVDGDDRRNNSSVVAINADSVRYDAIFQGGSIPIGNKEVDATNGLQSILGMTLRPIKDTLIDMTKTLLLTPSST